MPRRRPRAVFVPGHTEGHTAFHLGDRGILFSGDELITKDPLSRRRGPQLAPSSLNDDHDLARASLTALEGLDASLVLPGHGEPWSGTPAAAVAGAREADAFTTLA